MANKLTLENILKTYTSDKEWIRIKVEEHADYPNHTNECGVCNKMRQLTDNAEQSILQWVVDTLIGDDSDTPNVMIAMEHSRQLEMLKAHGWKES